MPRYNTPEDFWKKMQVKEPHECWEWIAGFDSAGRAKAFYEGRMILAHRYAFYLTYNYWPIETYRTCKNVHCCNPHHIREKDVNKRTKRRVSPGH